MFPRPRRVLRFVLVVAALLGNAAASPAPRPATPSPRLLVVVAADGLSWDRLWTWRAWWTAGFKRLLDEGLVERECRYRHLNTETGPGHASLSTGAPPRVHGIVLNDWYEQAPDGAMKSVYCASEPATGAGEPPSGPSRLKVPTLGDRLVAASPGTRVVSIAAKDRAAILLAGRDRRHAVLWYSYKTGRIETSPAYDAESPANRAARAVVERLYGRLGPEALETRFGRTWERLPVPSPAPTPGPEAVPASAQNPLVGLGFPHDLREDPRGFADALRVSPYADVLMTDLALALLADPDLALGRRGVPDVLAIGLSAHDGVAHTYGSESEEALELLRRLDVQIGRLLAAADARFPKGAVVVALSADHGFSPLPEVAKRKNPAAPGGRVDPGLLYAAVNDRVRKALCLASGNKPILAMEGWGFYYDRGKLPLARGEACGGGAVDRAALDSAVRRAVLEAAPDSLRAAFAGAERADPPIGETEREFVRNAFDAERSADVLVLPRPGWSLGGGSGRGASHGTQHECDVHVPLIFWGGGFPARQDDAPSTPYDLAPTMAARIGLRLPDAVGADRGK